MNKRFFNYGNINFLWVMILAVSIIAISSFDRTHVFANKIIHRLQYYWGLVKPDLPMVSNVRVLRDISYGNDAKQRMDLYLPAQAKSAPIIVWLHGGGFEGGDKSKRNGYINKVNRWLPRGFLLVSLNTRLLPHADAYDQMHDLASALIYIQTHAAEWGGDAKRLFLMGHSSAGTMVAALAADSTLVTTRGGIPWLGSISLEATSLDIPKNMGHWHPNFMDRAFGSDKRKWPKASPSDLLNKDSLPLLLVCSTLRRDKPCKEAERVAQHASALGVTVDVVPQRLDHGDVNFRLGLDGDYTHKVERFMAKLDTETAQLLRDKHNERGAAQAHSQP